MILSFEDKTFFFYRLELKTCLLYNEYVCWVPVCNLSMIEILMLLTSYRLNFPSGYLITIFPSEFTIHYDCDSFPQISSSTSSSPTEFFFPLYFCPCLFPSIFCHLVSIPTSRTVDVEDCRAEFEISLSITYPFHFLKFTLILLFFSYRIM